MHVSGSGADRIPGVSGESGSGCGASPPDSVSTASTSGPSGQAAANGDYLVGADIASGVWQCRDTGTSMYWATTDRAGEIIDNDLGSIARVPETAFAVKLKGCIGDWRQVNGEPNAAGIASSASVMAEDSLGTDSTACFGAQVLLGEHKQQLDEILSTGKTTNSEIWQLAFTFVPLPIGSSDSELSRAITRFRAIHLSRLR